MGESLHNTDGTPSITLTCDSTDSTETQVEDPIRLKLQKPKKDKKVNWTTETVDNEGMDKKKSKCCCIYKKPRANLEDSSSDDDDLDCDSCRGHVENKKKHTECHPDSSSEPSSSIS